MKFLRRILAPALTLALALALVEGSLQVLWRLFPALEGLTRRPSFPPILDEELGYLPNPEHPEHDALGFRNARLLERSEIVALGDSQTYGSNQPSDVTWPRQLAQQLGVRVYNMAFPSYGPVHNLAWFDRALDFQPKLIIMALYFGNDFYDAYTFIYRKRVRFPELRNSDPEALAAMTAADSEEPLHERIGLLFDQVHGTEREREPPAGTLKLPLIGRRLAGMSQALYVARWGSSTSALNTPFWLLVKHRAGAKGEVFHAYEDDTFRTVFHSRMRGAVVDLRDPRIREGFRISMEVLRRMGAEAESRGSAFLVLLVPTKELVFQEVVEASGREIPDVYYEHARWEAQTRRDAMTFLDTAGVEYLDSLPAMRAVLREGLQPYKLTGDGHPNGLAFAAIAESLLERLQQRGPFAVTAPQP